MRSSIYSLVLAGLLVACKSDNNNTVTPNQPTNASEYTVSTVAGSDQEGRRDGQGTAASFKIPTSLACDKQDNILVADQGNDLIRKVDPTGLVTTVAGGGGSDNWLANTDPRKASLQRPQFISFAPNGELLISENGDRYYRKPNVLFRTFSATGGIKNVSYTNPPVTFKPELYGNLGVMQDAAGSYYLLEDEAIRKISVQGAHTPNWVPVPHAVGIQFIGNMAAMDGNGTVYFPTESFASLDKGPIKKVSAEGKITYLRDAKYSSATLNGKLADVHIGSVSSLAVDQQGNLYVVGEGDKLTHNRIFKITPDGTVSFIAGGSGEGYKDGTGKQATFSGISGIAVDSKGAIYVADWSRIRKISLVK